MRKKYYLEEIENELKSLRIENARLKENVVALTEENTWVLALWVIAFSNYSCDKNLDLQLSLVHSI